MGIAIIDGDVLAYLACKSRYKDGEVVKIWDKNKPTFSMAEDALYIEDCWKNFKKLIEEVKEATFSNEHVMAVKDSNNYRDIIYPIVEIDTGVWVGYKACRMKAPEDSNVFVPQLRDRAVESGLGIYATWREADDLVCMWATQCAKAGIDYTIVSVDKDLKCIPGKHYNPKTKEHCNVTQVEALRFQYAQLLMGDPVDDIPGIYRMGPKTAAKLLKDCDSEDEMQFVVTSEYQNAYGDKWEEYLLANGKLLHIQRHEDDWFTLRDWMVA